MPVIMEEDDVASDVAARDFSELLHLPDPLFATSGDAFLGTTVEEDALQSLDSSHLDPTNNLHNETGGDWELFEPTISPNVGIEEPDYAKFENWIPQFIRPEKPCEYCRVKRLNCYITRGQTACTPCNSLFRDCTLTNVNTLETANQVTGYLLDTLHIVDEDAVREQGSATSIKALRSKARASGTTTPVRDDAPGSSKRNGIRFPRHAVKTLRDWLDAHADNPYPTEEEKLDLERQTELKPAQINNWLANARRRKKSTKPKLCSSPSLKPKTPAIDIPRPERPEKPWDELNPFERWKHTPPENEPASITDIANAVANSELVDDDQVSTSPSSLGRKGKRSSNGSGFENIRAHSTTSFETGQSSSLSATNSAYSHHSSQSRGSFGSFSSGLAGKRDRRRRKRTAPAPVRKLGDDKKRIFQCTFCTDTFKSKYDWTRHEKSLHLSLEKWICHPLGPVITDPSTNNKRCVYCDELNPSDDHLETHNHRQCEEKGMDARTFFRKDHLRQHLRLMHNCEMTPFMDNWKSVAVNINARCGFCAQRFSTWQERVDHLTAHFKAGARMSEWKGCRGLDPAVAAQVTNAMPPYLIGIESVSPNPFSASNKGTWRETGSSEVGDSERLIQEATNHYNDCPFELEPDEIAGFGSKATCWEILTVRLGKYANEMAKQGTILTDEMLQTQARQILYGSDDSWNQTAADNPEWLDLFKKAHGLDFIPTRIGGQGSEVPADLETYQDLGLRIPFAVQLKAYNKQLNSDPCFCDLIAGPHTEDVHEDQVMEQMRTLYKVLGREGVLHDSEGKCKHTECDNNVLQVSSADFDRSSKSKYVWCTYDLAPEKALEVARLTGPAWASETPNAQDFNATALEPISSNQAQCSGADGSRKRQNRLPRHRYELPRHRAGRFETITPAWNDSGSMPNAIPTYTTSADFPYHQTTSTGAMMEFLGGDIGRDLPFRSDAETSTIPLSNDFGDWAEPATAAQEAAMLEVLDQLIAETTQGQLAPSTSATDFQVSTAAMDMPMDFAMEDVNFDELDMNFDSVFDMTMDEYSDQI